ncbi:MAG: ABC transporter ATP-binding protein [Bacillota bacterium]
MAMAAQEYLQLKEISFFYREQTEPVWKDLSCRFIKNAVNLILGPSGCGKSSLLYLIDGLIPNSLEGTLSGSVLLRGEELLGHHPKELAKQIGLVFQDPDTQFCTFSVEDELAFGLENLSIDPSEIGGRIDRALSLVGMKEHRHCLLSSLSTGQKQKIAIASALVMDAELLLLDEPTANLDAVSRRETIELIRSLVEEHHKTVIIVEHNLDELIEHVDHIVVFDSHGSPVLEGGAHDVMARLAFDPAFYGLSVCLPHSLLVLGEWVRRSGSIHLNRLKESLLEPKGERQRFRFPFERVAAVVRALEPADPPRAHASGVCSAGTPWLETEGLSFAFQSARRSGAGRAAAAADAVVLRDVNLSIDEGDFAAIVGPNGAGKSTLLNVLFKCHTNYGGSVRVGGKELRTIPPRALYREMGYLFQNPELQFLANTVEEELLFSLKKESLSETEKKQRVQRSLEQFHLLEQRSQSPFVLSQGQKRRLSVATMLLTGQKALFLDEPTFGQDRENLKELMELMQKLNREGTTIVMVTHDMTLVAEYARKIYLIDEGVVKGPTQAEQLYYDPDALSRGRLAVPPILGFSHELQARVPGFPGFINGDRCLEYLLGLSPQAPAEGENSDVCL